MAALGTVLVLTGCGGDSGTSSTPPPPFNGTWRGNAQDNVAGAGTFEATLAQTGTRVTGTWRIAFPAAGFENGGSLNGTASVNALQATLEPSDPTTCPFNLTGNLAGTVLSGTYAAFNCTGTITGSFSATRR
jgi:hypothetical protein